MITGASAGVGRACAYEFAKRGDKIGLISRNEERLKGLQKELEEMGRVSKYFVADVSEYDLMEEAVEVFEKELGEIDVWVNNAMASVFSPVKHMEAKEYKRVTDVTYLGTVYGTLAVLKKMRERNRGVIIQVGSALAYRGIPLQSAYCAAKHAIQGFHDSLRSELLHEKSHIRVSMVQLPALNTPQFDWVRSKLKFKAQPVPPIFQPEVAAKAIVWASEHPRKEVLVGFPTFKAVWGDRFFSPLLDYYLALKGYESQQTKEAESERDDNLFSSVEGDYGAHGRFDDRAKEKSWYFWMSTHYINWVIFAVIVILILWILLI